MQNQRPIEDIYRWKRPNLDGILFCVHPFQTEQNNPTKEANLDDVTKISAKFMLVGFPNDTIEMSWDPDYADQIVEMHHALIKHFNIDGKNYRLLFHVHRLECCWIQRPFSDFFSFGGYKFEGQTICWHPVHDPATATKAGIGSVGLTKRYTNVAPTETNARPNSKPQQPSTQSGPQKEAGINTTTNMNSTATSSPSQNPGEVSTTETSQQDPAATSGPKIAQNRDAIEFKITFRFTSPDQSLSLTGWSDQEEYLSGSTSMEGIFQAARASVVEALSKDENLKRMRNYISFRPMLWLDKDMARCGHIDKNGECRVETVGDLFEEIQSDPRLDVIIQLKRLGTRIALEANTIEEDGETIPTRSAKLRELVVNDWDNDVEYYRVGTKSVGERGGPAVTRRPQQEHALVAWYGKQVEGANMNDLYFGLVPTWYSGPFIIGDNDLRKAMKSLPQGTNIDDKYQPMPNMTKSDIHKYLTGEDSGQSDISVFSDRLPQMPPHCFNPNDADMMGTPFPDWHKTYDSVTVKGPFVYYDDEGELRAKERKVLEFFNITVKEEHSREDICNFLDGELGRAITDRKDTKLRFNGGKRKSDYKYDLWVLPRRPGGVRKVFRYKKGKLSQFMTPGGMKEKAQMYMEAHIVPKDTDKSTD